MRLWSIHPRFLDWMGLGALWRESLLAQAVLAGETRGWRKHPQLNRFREHPEPIDAVGFYLKKVREEASHRGYSYDASKIRKCSNTVESITVTMGQLLYEFTLILERTRLRTPEWHKKLVTMGGPVEAHPIFRVIDGEVGSWEVSYWRGGAASKGMTYSHQAATSRSLASS